MHSETVCNKSHRYF